MVRSLKSELGGVALTGRVGDDGQLVLGVDLDRLTRQLPQRLDRHPDVEYAQLDYLLRPLR